MKTMFVGLLGFLIVALSYVPGRGLVARELFGGSSSHSYGCASHDSAWGGSTSHTAGEGTSHSSAYGTSTSHAYGWWDGAHQRLRWHHGRQVWEGAYHTGAYGATAYHPPTYGPTIPLPITRTIRPLQ